MTEKTLKKEIMKCVREHKGKLAWPGEKEGMSGSEWGWDRQAPISNSVVKREARQWFCTGKRWDWFPLASRQLSCATEIERSEKETKEMVRRHSSNSHRGCWKSGLREWRRIQTTFETYSRSQNWQGLGDSTDWRWRDKEVSKATLTFLERKLSQVVV